VYVARAQVASAINLIVQLTRFSEDGSRKITRITEARGLDNQNYVLEDLFVSRRRGVTRNGRIMAELEFVGNLPSFSKEPYEHGMDDRIELTKYLWEK
jgi:pilus assembly protein CpaF